MASNQKEMITNQGSVLWIVLVVVESVLFFAVKVGSLPFFSVGSLIQ